MIPPKVRTHSGLLRFCWGIWPSARKQGGSTTINFAITCLGSVQNLFRLWLHFVVWSRRCQAHMEILCMVWVTVCQAMPACTYVVSLDCGSCFMKASMDDCEHGGRHGSPRYVLFQVLTSFFLCFTLGMANPQNTMHFVPGRC